MDAKPLRIRFDKVNVLIKIYSRIRYLELSDLYKEVYFEINPRICNVNFDRINYVISKKGISHNFARVRIDTNNYLHMEKAWTFDNVIISQLLMRIKIITTIIYS